jgi:WD40 repeat protein
MKSGRVFLCHNSREKEIIKSVALRLLSEGAIRTWLDTWEIPGGADWENHIRREFAASWSCLVFLGPSGLGPYQRIEIEWARKRQAIDPDYRLIPVVLPGVEESRFLELETLLPGVQRIALVEDLTAVLSALRGDGPGPPVQGLTVAVAAERWDQTGQRDRSLLIRGRALREAQRVASASGAFDDLSLAFLAASAAAAQRRLRWSVAALSVVTAVFAAGVWYTNNRRLAAEVAESNAAASEKNAITQRDIAINQTQLAERRLKLATSQAKAADARREIKQELRLALVDSVDAYRIDPSLDAQTALIESLTRAAKIKRYFLCPPGEKGTGATFSPDGNTFTFTCSLRDTTLFVIDVGGKVVQTVHLSGDARSIAFIDSGTIAIGGSRDIRILDSHQRRVRAYAGHHATISTVASAPGRQLLFTADSTGEVRLWRRAGPMRAWSSQILRDRTSRIYTNLTWQEGAGLLVDDVGGTGNPRTSIPIDDQGPGSAWPRVEQRAASDWCISKYPPAIRSITSGADADGGVFAYDTESNEIIVDDRKSCVPLYGHTHNFMLSLRPDGSNLVSVGAVANGDGIHGAILWDLKQTHPLAHSLRAWSRLYPRDARLFSSRDGSSWACLNCDDQVVWDGRELPFSDTGGESSPGTQATAIALSQDGGELAISTHANMIAIATRAANRLSVNTIGSVPASIRQMWFAGSSLYVVSLDGTLFLWTGDKWSTVREGPKRKDDSCGDISYVGPYFASEQSPDFGPHILTFQNLERPKSPLLLAPLPSDAGICSSLAYAGASHIAVRLTFDRKPAYLFSTGSRVDLRLWENPLHANSGLQTTLTSARISDDGRLLIAISHGDIASLVILDLTSGRLIGDLPVPGLTSVALSGDGKYAITFSEAGVLKWILDPADWAKRAGEIAGNPN